MRRPLSWEVRGLVIKDNILSNNPFRILTEKRSHAVSKKEGNMRMRKSFLRLIRPRKYLILSIAAVAYILSQDTSVPYRTFDHSTKLKRTLRHANDSCAKNPYINVKQAINLMPPAVASGTTIEQPSHITLCNELINRNKAAQLFASKQEKGEIPPVFTNFVVHESRHLCENWSTPHSALMEIISSSIIAYVGKRFGLKYQHKCHHSVGVKEDSLPFDVTNIQQIFPEASMPIDEREIRLGEVAHNLCKACIEQYNHGQFRNSLQETHHCLAFPRLLNVHEGTVRVEKFDKANPNSMPQVMMQKDIIDGQGHIVRSALSSVLPLVKNRLYHASLDWSSRSHIPAHDPKSGAVIYLDGDLSLAVPFWHYQEHISPAVTHISILSGPSCAQGHLLSGGIAMQMKGGILCAKYAFELRDYLSNHFIDKGVEVSFEIVASTAAAYSRMILSHTLICPPNTVSCLFPALAKEQSKTAVILESPQLGTTFHWFTYFGNSAKNIKVIPLNPQQLKMDQEQAFIDSQYAGFSVGEVIQKLPEDQEHSQGQQQNNPPPHQNQISNDRSDLDSISMNINQNPQPVENTADINQEGYKLLKDDHGSIFKTVDEAQKEAEHDHQATGNMIDTSTSSEEQATEDSQKVGKIHLDFGINQNKPEGDSNNLDGEVEEDEDPNFDFDFEALFGRER